MSPFFSTGAIVFALIAALPWAIHKDHLTSTARHQIVTVQIIALICMFVMMILGFSE